jgi:hypothetical protein
MTIHWNLHMEIATYWHAGTGRGISLQVDSLVRRDRRGLPLLPGRTVKGLLRDALSLAGDLGWVAPTLAGQLFGNTGLLGQVLVSPARLPRDIADIIAAKDDLRGGLFETLFATAIDSESGTALRKSLRSMEVVVPLLLEVGLTGPNPSSEWIDPLSTCLPLLRAVGSHRNRGLGRVGRLELAESGAPL